MKLNGIKLGKYTQTVVMPRPDGNVAFKVAPVDDDSVFEELVDMPRPKVRTYPDGRVEPILDDPAFQERHKKYITRRVDWLILNSLMATPDLVWETVDLKDPETWGNWHREMLDAGFSNGHINYLVGVVNDVNGIGDEAIKKATADFLATERALKVVEPILPGGPSSMPSGGLANG
jgi:exopolysaccharide biosynthesis predicted pyruvyltransferase EpsI